MELVRQLERHFGQKAAVAAGCEEALARLRAYFAGELSAFRDAQLELCSTQFQVAVWRELGRIPEVTTCRRVAARVGQPRAARAVGGACHTNLIGIAVPCHRVVGASGALAGYAGGLERKRWLLAHEGALGTNGLVACA